ncbi:MAG: hypothetical protein ACJA2C_000686 [Marinoscillum sp.]|jgi:hypothetical protein
MKKISKISFLSLLLILGACVDLEEDAVNQLRTNYFQDINSLKAAVSGSYRMLISDGWERSVQVASFRVPLMGADDFTTITGANKEDFRQFDQFYASAGNARLNRASWALLYDVIRQTTWDIEGAATLVGKYEEAEINAIVAESYFLRSWSYFWLVRLFGPLPLIDFTTYDESIYRVTRSPVEDVYALILSDMEFAEQYLPASQNNYGNPTTWSAKAYLAEIHLSMAGWPLKQTSHYATARDYAKDVLDNGPFSLMDNYGDLFVTANEGNNELIWTIPFCPVGDCGGGFSGSWMSKGTKPAELQGWEDMFIELSFYERYPEGPRKDFVMLDRLKVESTDANDPSYTRQLGEETIVVHYKYIDYTQFTSGHPFMKKYWDGFYDTTIVANDPNQNISAQSPLDLPMIRLAKVQLMYAEAQAKADGSPSAESFEYLNQIRRRGKGYLPNAVGSDVDLALGSLDANQFARQVVDEKGWELVGELNRWFDLTRTERVKEVNDLRSPNELLQIQKPITEDFYYAPIPSTERAINPLLTQNPGYTD